MTIYFVEKKFELEVEMGQKGSKKRKCGQEQNQVEEGLFQVHLAGGPGSPDLSWEDEWGQQAWYDSQVTCKVQKHIIT